MKKIFNKKIKILIIILIACGIFFGFREKMKAVGGVLGSFGGLRLFTTPCTCSLPATLVMIYDYKLKAPINLVFYPGISRLYSNFNIFYSTYMLGSYTPSTGLCWFYAGTTCVESSAVGLPTIGTIDMLPGVGTSGL